MEPDVVSISHLKKTFGNNTVLKDVNMKLHRGENLVILGKSGSGKSVLIKCLLGLVEADSGELVVLGNSITGLNVTALNAVRKKTGFLFQSGALYDSMTVRENLEFPLRGEKNLSRSAINERVMQVLTSVGLEASIEKMPSELSGGMRKRIGLARTLMLQPEIILYDEPTTGLDPITSKEISRLILQVQKDYNTSSIIITHDVECARIVANRVIIMREGVFFAEGTFAELARSDDAWVRSFFE